MSSILQHPSLGTFHGRSEAGVVQFLGIQYATLEDRLAEPQLKTEYGGQIDATKVGPQTVSSPTGCKDEFRLIQQALPLEKDTFATSDCDGLHVNIAVPVGATDLPVLVFLHGGGFRTGSNSWPQYDLARLVRLAAELGTPFIGVTINYRVGVPGFLTSQELRDAGYKANNGLRDQRTALLWVKQFIDGFGGNPDRVTLAGQSAGAVAAMLHLQSKEPLFDQLLLMSGTSLVVPPLNEHTCEAAYSKTVQVLGLECQSSTERIKAIVDGPSALLYERITPDIPLGPVIDNDLVHTHTSFELLAKGSTAVKAGLLGSTWCRRLLIGDCAFDASVYSEAFEHRKVGLYKAFHRSLTASAPSLAAVEALEKAYGISTDSDDHILVRNILRWATDVGFSEPARAMAQVWPSPAFLYHINTPNPWDGRWQGEAIHTVDVMLLFQNYNEQVPKEHQEVARQYATSVASFVAGQDPFPSCAEEPHGAMLYSHGAEFVVSEDATAFGRRDIVDRLASIYGLNSDAQMSAWHRLLAGQ